MAKHRHRPPDAGRNRFETPERKTKGTKVTTPENPKSFGWIVHDEIPASRDDFESYRHDTYTQMASMLAGRAYSGGATASQPRVDPIDRELAAAREPVEQYLHKAGAHDVQWDDVIGNERARTALLEAIEHPHVHKDLHAHYGVLPPKGALLFGPPGCGKTMLAKATAAALARLYGKDAELLIVNGPEIQSMWVGQTEGTIRAIFAFARVYARKHGHPLVVFIDEADAILPDRSNGRHWEASNVATFLTEMDGMQQSGAFIILATNRPDTIDGALLRDGRIDRRIKVERPDRNAAARIAAKALARTPVRGADPGDLADYLFDVQHILRPVTNQVTGMVHHFLLAHTISGATVVALVERAKGVAMRRDLADQTITGITGADLRTAVDDLFAEQKELAHEAALREFVEDVAIPLEQARHRQAMN